MSDETAAKTLGPFAGVPFPEPGHILILSREQDGFMMWLAPSAETFADTDWGNWAALVADARVAYGKKQQAS
jgi:hypothetical protein